MRCLTCKFWFIEFGCSGYSDQTPGQPGSWECAKGIWDLGPGSDKSDVVRAMANGETCQEWESDSIQHKT